MKMVMVAKKMSSVAEQFEEDVEVIYCGKTGCPGSTGLRCYRTDVPICQKCSIRTDVGYLSKDAARTQQNQFFDVESYDYVIAAFAAFFPSLIAGFIIGQLWFLFAIFLSAPAGGMISEIVFRALRKRRGRYISQTVAVSMALSVLMLFPFTSFFSLIIYAFVAIGSATARFKLSLRV